jgi:hypothetical protein
MKRMSGLSQRTSNIFYNIHRIERPVTSYKDLYFMTQPALQFKSVCGRTNKVDIPKTVIVSENNFDIESISRTDEGGSEAIPDPLRKFNIELIAVRGTEYEATKMRPFVTFSKG